MKTSTLLLITLFGAGVGGILATGCDPTEAEDCSAATCPNGCCDADGVCQAGILNDACGLGGAACQVCSGNLTCQSGLCASVGGGGDGGHDGGGGADGGDGGVVGNDGGTEGSQWCDDYVQATCAHQFRCSTASSVQACLETSGLFYDQFCSLIIARALDDGRITSDPQVSDTCFDFVANSFSCEAGEEDPTTENATCATLLVGTVAQGGACYTDAECQSGGWCDNSGTCPGICKAQVGLGEFTTQSSACEDGLYLYFGDDTCREPVASGGDCSPLGGASTRQDCVGGHHCDNDTSLCTPKGLEGDDCAHAGQCIPTLMCSQGLCTARGDVGEDCQGQSCMYGLFCESAQPSGPGICAARGGEGAGCFEHDDCASAFWCSGPDAQTATKGQCTTRAAQSEACGDSSECESSLYCADGACQPRKPTGASCTGTDECEGGSCNAGVCGEFFGFCADPTP